MIGRRTGKPASTCSAPTSACPMHRTPARTLPSLGGSPPKPPGSPPHGHPGYHRAPQGTHCDVLAGPALRLHGRGLRRWRLQLCPVPRRHGQLQPRLLLRGTVNFGLAEFSSGAVFFNGPSFSGGTVDLGYANFSGGEVDFSAPDDWSVPPTFPWTDMPPQAWSSQVGSIQGLTAENRLSSNKPPFITLSQPGDLGVRAPMAAGRCRRSPRPGHDRARSAA
jgi:hypothetical protein